MEKEKILEILKKLKAEKKRFVQSIELVITLKGIDTKKQNVDVSIVLPHKVKDRKICLFAEKSVLGADKIFDKVILKEQFANYDKKKAKKLAKEFDFFVSQASLMASVASAFGKVLGPAGKMPSPTNGSIIIKTDEKFLKETIEKLSKTIRAKTTKNDTSLKFIVGHQKMPDKEISKNIHIV